MTPGPELALAGHTTARHCLTLLYRFDRVLFTATLWYPTVDFDDLERRYGTDVVDHVVFHILLFHGQKIQSLKPARLLLGPYSRFWTPELAGLWAVSTRATLAQWRFETGNLGYTGAEVVTDDRVAVTPAAPAEVVAGEVPLLAGNGGGKDSLVMARLLDRAGIRFDTFSLNFHTDADPIARVAGNERFLARLTTPPRVNHPHYVVESFLNSPAARSHGVPGLHVPHLRNDDDTPMAHGFFDLLPLMLAGGYTDLCFGNERSADSENVVVDGERINHAWAKTAESEELFETYVRSALMPGFSAYSLLKPCSDVFIYRTLADLAGPGDVAEVHSCNVEPPWCRRCPKCAYVWLSYRAYLPGHPEVAEALGPGSPFGRPELRAHYRQLLGLEQHKPFECVGEVDEVRLAFELCVRAGETGGAIEDYVRGCRLDAAGFDGLRARYDALDHGYRRLPPRLAAVLTGQADRLAALPKTR